MMTKDELRRIFTARRKALTPDESRRADAAITARLTTATAPAELLGGYRALPGEPDLTAFLQAALAAGKNVALPRYDQATGVYEMVPVRDLKHDCVTGRYGIAEPRPELPPLPRREIAARMLWLIPGVAFDATGTRLGRGGGFYDRLLEGTTGGRIGVFYHCQMAEEALPTAAHDCRLNIAITEKTIIHFGSGGDPAGTGQPEKRNNKC